MLRTAGLLASPKEALTAGFDGGISPAAAALLFGCWVITEAGLSPASPTGLIWAHRRPRPTGNRGHDNLASKASIGSPAQRSSGQDACPWSALPAAAGNMHPVPAQAGTVLY